MGVKGTIPWNKGKSLSNIHRENISKANIRLGKKPPVLIGEKNHNWKGDEVSYRSLHKWVQARLGKPRCCDDCGNTNLKHRQYHWANISGLYKRIITDWKRLCAKCHKKFDKK